MLVMRCAWVSQALGILLAHEKRAGMGLKEIHPLVFISDDQAAPFLGLGARFDLAIHAAQMLLR